MFGSEARATASSQIAGRLVTAVALAALADGQRTLAEEEVARSVLRRLPAFEAFDDATLSMLLAGAFLDASSSRAAAIAKVAEGIDEDARWMVYAVATRVVLADHAIDGVERAFLTELAEALSLSGDDARSIEVAIEGALGGEAPLAAVEAKASEAFEARMGEADEAWGRNERLIAEAAYSKAFEEACRIGVTAPEWTRALHRLVEVRVAMERFAEAEDLLRRALTLQTRDLGDDARVADTLNRLGVRVHSAARADEARELYERALAMLDRVGSRDPTTRGRIEWNLGLLYGLTRRLDDAARAYSAAIAHYASVEGEPSAALTNVLAAAIDLLRWSAPHVDLARQWMTRRVAICERAHGAASDAHRDALSALCQHLRFNGRYGEAAPLYKAWLALRDKPDAKTVAALGDLASVCVFLHDHAGRVEALERAAAAAETVYGSDAKETADALYAHASAVMERSPRDAIAPFERALALRERLLAPDAADLRGAASLLATCYDAAGRAADRVALDARMLRHLGDEPTAALVTATEAHANGLFRAGKHAEADAQFERAISLATEVFGARSVETARLLERRGFQLTLANRPREAESALALALAAYEASGQGDPSSVQTMLAARYAESNRHADAAQLYAAVAARQSTALGPDSPILLCTLPILAQCYEKSDRLEEAEATHARIVSIVERSKGPLASDLTRPLDALVKVQARRARWPEATANAERVVEILRAARGGEHSDVANAINDSANVYVRAGQLDLANDRYGAARDQWKRTLGAQHAYVAVACHNLGVNLLRLGRSDAACEALAEAVAVRERALGPSDGRTAASQYFLAKSHLASGRLEEAIALLRKVLATEAQAFGANSTATRETRGALIDALRAAERGAEADALQAEQGASSA